MKEKVVELLILIMSEMHDNKRLTEIDLDELKERGYTQSEISTAFSWLMDHAENERSGAFRESPTPGSRRLFHEAEKFVFSTEAQGYLIQARELGLLDDRDLEAVIERAMMAGYEKLSVSEVRVIVASVLFSHDGGEGGARRSMLDSGDSVH
jgi:uncharacterized protein Smg (DUF494 family)